MLAGQHIFTPMLDYSFAAPYMQVARHARCAKISKKFGSHMVDFSFYAANHRLVAETDESHDPSVNVFKNILMSSSTVWNDGMSRPTGSDEVHKKLDFSPASLGNLDKIIKIACNRPE